MDDIRIIRLQCGEDIIANYNYNDETTEIVLSDSDNWSFGSEGILKDIGPRGSFLPNPSSCLGANVLLISLGLHCYSSPETGMLFTADENTICSEMALVNVKTSWHDNNNKLIVYPNPAYDKIFFDNKDVGLINDIFIYNIYGQKVSELKNYNDDYIDISSFSDGLYFIIISTKNEQFSSNFIKM